MPDTSWHCLSKGSSNLPSWCWTEGPVLRAPSQEMCLLPWWGPLPSSKISYLELQSTLVTIFHNFSDFRKVSWLPGEEEREIVVFNLAIFRGTFPVQPAVLGSRTLVRTQHLHKHLEHGWCNQSRCGTYRSYSESRH